MLPSPGSSCPSRSIPKQCRGKAELLPNFLSAEKQILTNGSKKPLTSSPFLIMALESTNLEIYGRTHVPEEGALLVANRLSFEDLLHLEKLFSDRRRIYLIERGMDYDKLLHAHLEKADTAALEFSAEDFLSLLISKGAKIHYFRDISSSTRRLFNE